MAVIQKVQNRLASPFRAGLGLRLAKSIANTMGRPNLAGVMVTNLRLWMKPFEYRRRQDWAKHPIGTNQNAIDISKETGYFLFGPGKLASVNKITKICGKILDAKGRDNLATWHETRAKNAKSKSYFYNILEEEDIFQYPELMEFATSDEVLSALIPYYGMVPRLCSIGLYYSKVSEDGASGSQNFHLDGTDPHHVKCFINLTDVGPKDGPLTFIPADKTDELRNDNGGPLKSAGLEDAQKLASYEKEYRISLTGAPSSGAFVDASRCLHYGSRCEENPRIVFMFHYAVFANYTELPKNPLRDLRMQHYPDIRRKFGVDELRKSVLRID